MPAGRLLSWRSRSSAASKPGSRVDRQGRAARRALQFQQRRPGLLDRPVGGGPPGGAGRPPGQVVVRVLRGRPGRRGSSGRGGGGSSCSHERAHQRSITSGGGSSAPRHSPRIARASTSAHHRSRPRAGRPSTRRPAARPRTGRRAGRSGRARPSPESGAVPMPGARARTISAGTASPPIPPGWSPPSSVATAATTVSSARTGRVCVLARSQHQVQEAVSHLLTSGPRRPAGSSRASAYRPSASSSASTSGTVSRASKSGHAVSAVGPPEHAPVAECLRQALRSGCGVVAEQRPPHLAGQLRGSGDRPRPPPSRGPPPPPGRGPVASVIGATRSSSDHR